MVVPCYREKLTPFINPIGYLAMAFAYVLHDESKRHRKSSDSVLRQKLLYQQKIQQKKNKIDNKKTPTKTPISHRRRTVCWSNNRRPTSVVKPVYGLPIFQLTAKAKLNMIDETPVPVCQRIWMFE